MAGAPQTPRYHHNFCGVTAMTLNSIPIPSIYTNKVHMHGINNLSYSSQVNSSIYSTKIVIAQLQMKQSSSFIIVWLYEPIKPDQ